MTYGVRHQKVNTLSVLTYAVRHILIEPIQCPAQAVAATAAMAWHTT